MSYEYGSAYQFGDMRGSVTSDGDINQRFLIVLFENYSILDPKTFRVKLTIMYLNCKD